MAGDLIIKLISWFVLKQLEKFLDKIDWQKVADDFIEILKKLFPARLSGDLMQLQCKQHILGLGQRFKERNVFDHFGKQSWPGACKEWLEHGSSNVAGDEITRILIRNIEMVAPISQPSLKAEIAQAFDDVFETDVMADGHAVVEVPRRGRRPKA